MQNACNIHHFLLQLAPSVLPSPPHKLASPHLQTHTQTSYTIAKTLLIFFTKAAIDMDWRTRSSSIRFDSMLRNSSQPMNAAPHFHAAPKTYRPQKGGKT
jgi:hypothetical protein